MDMQQIIRRNSVKRWITDVRLGVEKESLRVTDHGGLSEEPHPATFGDRSFHPYIQTDFAENQMELITPVTASSEELIRWLAAIHDVAQRSLPEGEALWPLSMPPALPEDPCQIPIAKLANFEDVLYRRYLAKTYGRRKQMISGIHFNFEFGEKLMDSLFTEQAEYSDLQQFKTAVYLKVTRNYLRYRWLITYLFGAAPLSEAHFFEGEAGPAEPVRSIRNSSFGYCNKTDVEVSYQDLETYLADIDRLVETGRLSEEKEYYAPVRFRGGERVKDLAEKGIRYIELRNIDNQPFAPYGLTKSDVDFIHLFMLLMLWLPEELPADEWIAIGDERNEQVALENPLATTKYQEEGQWLLQEMTKLAQATECTEAVSLIAKMAHRLQEPGETPAAHLLKESQQSSQQLVALRLAKDFHEAAWQKPYQLAGFTSLELSTQILMFDGIQKGVAIQVLDEADQFLQLSFKGKQEYVKNANMTSKDTYIAPLLMANKTVTKKVLQQAGFAVPEGAEFNNLAAALQAYPRFSGKAIVVKPKSTNYGLGISIFKEGPQLEAYETALAIAFAEDDAVLVEEYIEGTEYRFFVLAGEVLAIMLRVPANVRGDGEKTIAELVAAKNQALLRGSHHRAPLEEIQLGEIENLMLQEQGYTPSSIPAADTVVYLRENSNVSTGGDSLDVTDSFSEDYKRIAAEAVTAIGAAISGIDLIIPDKDQPAEAPGAYHIIEANFNPAMHMHVYPYEGQSRRLTLAVLQFLFPELTI